MFNFCSNIEKLPDISKWNTSKVTKKNNMFSNCIKLGLLPDINKWNTSSLVENNFMFHNSLIYNIPSKFKITN